MDKATARRLTSKLAGFFPATPDLTIAAYAERMVEVGWDAGIAEEAVDLCIQNLSRFPSWSQLLDVVRGIRGPLPASDPYARPDIPVDPDAQAKFAALTEHAFGGNKLLSTMTPEELRAYCDETYWNKYGFTRPSEVGQDGSEDSRAKARRIVTEAGHWRVVGPDEPPITQAWDDPPEPVFAPKPTPAKEPLDA